MQYAFNPLLNAINHLQKFGDQGRNSTVRRVREGIKSIASTTQCTGSG